jgi:hypothetical protein
MSRSGVTSRSALPHSRPSRLGGHSRLRKPTSTSIRAISNFGTGKSRTCARLGCLRIERWAREGIARANVAFPPIATSTVAIANGSLRRFETSLNRIKCADSGPSAIAMQWQECANTGHSQTARRMGQFDPFRAFRSVRQRKECARKRPKALREPCARNGFSLHYRRRAN